MTNSVVIAVQVEELAKDPGTSPGTKTLGDETYAAWKFNSSPLNMYQTPKGKDRLPNIIVQGRTSGVYQVGKIMELEGRLQFCMDTPIPRLPISISASTTFHCFKFCWQVHLPVKCRSS